MISEVTFSKKFTSFWNEILPNSKSYLRLINNGLVESECPPLDSAERKNNIALVNVISFNMIRGVINNRYIASQIEKNDFFESSDFLLLVDESSRYLSRFSSINSETLPLSSIEKEQALQIYQIMKHKFIKKNYNVVVDPMFEGCGFINKSFGDLWINSKLVEVKSGERKFSLIDLRQLLIYLTLNNYSRDPLLIQKVELFNPRIGLSFKEDTEAFCENLSALSSQELYSEIQKFIINQNFVEMIDV